MRRPQEIDNARCVIGSILLDRPPLNLGEKERIGLARLEDALCWVMGLDCCHARNFATILESLKTQAAQLGWRIDLDEPLPHVRDASSN